MKTFDIIEPSLEQLFNVQRARAYEFFLEIRKYQRSKYDTQSLSSYDADLQEYIYDPSSKWKVSPGSEMPKKFIETYNRLFLAKKKFERAGGKYRNFK